MRAFIAINITQEIENTIGTIQEKLNASHADVKWVETNNIHITLKFLGEIDDAQCNKLKQLLSVIANQYKPFKIEISGIDSFPERGNPRVIWADCKGEINILKALANSISKCAEEVGVPKETREFLAHLTIGRVKSNKNIPALRKVMEEVNNKLIGAQLIKDFILYKSELRSSGPIYTALEKFQLVI